MVVQIKITATNAMDEKNKSFILEIIRQDNVQTFKIVIKDWIVLTTTINLTKELSIKVSNKKK